MYEEPVLCVCACVWKRCHCIVRYQRLGPCLGAYVINVTQGLQSKYQRVHNTRQMTICVHKKNFRHDNYVSRICGSGSKEKIEIRRCPPCTNIRGWDIFSEIPRFAHLKLSACSCPRRLTVYDDFFLTYTCIDNRDRCPRKRRRLRSFMEKSGNAFRICWHVWSRSKRLMPCVVLEVRYN